MESREEEGVSRDHEEEEGGKETRAKLCTVLSRDLEFGWFGWEGGKTRNQRRAATCSQAPEAEEDFQKQGLFWVFF